MTTAEARFRVGGLVLYMPAAATPTAPAPAGTARPSMVVTRIFTAGVGREGSLAEPTTEFAPDAPKIYVRFQYEGAAPGEEVRARWVVLSGANAEAFEETALGLQNAAGRGQFSFVPPARGRWAEGTYRIELLTRDTVVAQTELTVRSSAARPKSPPAAAGPATPPPPAVASPSPRALGVADAAFTRDIAVGEPTERRLEFTTAHKRVLLWPGWRRARQAAR